MTIEEIEKLTLDNTMRVLAEQRENPFQGMSDYQINCWKSKTTHTKSIQSINY